VSGLRTLAGRLVKETAVLGDRVRPPVPGVVLLVYHRVGGGSDSEIDLPASRFDEQMAWLSERKAATTIAAAIDELDRPAPPADGTEPVRPVVVTFDDGTADVVHVALPILVRHRVPAVFYLSTDFVDRGRPFPGEAPAMTWSAAADAISTGLVTVGSHTHTHALLDRVAPDVAADELDRSRALIADRLGVEAEHFAYPKAVLGPPAIEALVRQRFRSAALGGNRPNPYGRTDPFRLARSAVQRSDGMRFFEHKAAGGMALEERGRAALNRVRYRGRVS
jgi:peptidoglycan/xylan/chitin deacetylase (PgdA/CDA1 family)